MDDIPEIIRKGYSIHGSEELQMLSDYYKRCWFLVSKFSFMLDAKDVIEWSEQEYPCVPVVFGRLLDHKDLLKLTT